MKTSHDIIGEAPMELRLPDERSLKRRLLWLPDYQEQ
jgi:hypothetical protein